MNLIVYGRDVTTVFDLLGSNENDMTFSLGWVLSRSPVFLRLLVEDLYGPGSWLFNKAVVRMQTGRGRDGITDIEIELGESLAFIIEAKKDPNSLGRNSSKNMLACWPRRLLKKRDCSAYEFITYIWSSKPILPKSQRHSTSAPFLAANTSPSSKCGHSRIA